MALWTGFPVGVGLEKPTPAIDIPPRKSLSCIAKSEHFERKLSRRFSLNDELLSTDSNAGESALLDLPYDVLVTIFSTIDHAPSQVAFALSCKRLALVASRVDLSLSTVSPKYAGFLPLAVFDVPELMTQLRSWMPGSLRLCNHCLTNRPSDNAAYWATIENCEVSNFWISKTGWTFSDTRWHKQVHDICPACHATCSLSDYVDCDGCRALGRLGDVDWTRLSDQRAGRWELVGNAMT